jgi:hypothetical protein
MLLCCINTLTTTYIPPTSQIIRNLAENTEGACGKELDNQFC